MDNNVTLKEIQEAIDLAVGSQEYGRVYRAFRSALAEAHAVLTVEDIEGLIVEAEEEFGCSCVCEQCASEAAKPATSDYGVN